MQKIRKGGNAQVAMNTQNKKIAEIIRRLKIEYAGTPQTVLRYSTPFELLVATILSAQTTDVLVNKVTADLFKKYRSAQDIANTAPEKLAQDIRSVNFFNNKARNINKTAQMLIEKFGGKVPQTMEELVSLPGVARKTANIVLSSAFGLNEGIAVDTHVKRLAYRLGLTKHGDPVKVEAARSKRRGTESLPKPEARARSGGLASAVEPEQALSLIHI